MNATHAATEITLAEAARSHLPLRNGKRIHVCTIKRWIICGCRGVKLVGWRRGNIWYTTPEAIEQFKIDRSRDASPGIRSPAAVTRAIQMARDTLRSRGFYGSTDAKHASACG